MFCYQCYLTSKMDLRDTCCEGRRWIELARDRVVVLAVLNLQVMID